MEQFLEPSVVQRQLSNRHQLQPDSLFIALQWKLAALADRPEYEQAIAEAAKVSAPFCRRPSQKPTIVDVAALDEKAEATVADFAKMIPANQIEEALRACAQRVVDQAKTDPETANCVALARAVQDGPKLLARLAAQRGAQQQKERQFAAAAGRAAHPQHPTLQ